MLAGLAVLDAPLAAPPAPLLAGCPDEHATRAKLIPAIIVSSLAAPAALAGVVMGLLVASVVLHPGLVKWLVPNMIASSRQATAGSSTA